MKDIYWLTHEQRDSLLSNLLVNLFENSHRPMVCPVCRDVGLVVVHPDTEIGRNLGTTENHLYCQRCTLQIR